MFNAWFLIGGGLNVHNIIPKIKPDKYGTSILVHYQKFKTKNSELLK